MHTLILVALRSRGASRNGVGITADLIDAVKEVVVELDFGGESLATVLACLGQHDGVTACIDRATDYLTLIGLFLVGLSVDRADLSVVFSDSFGVRLSLSHRNFETLTRNLLCVFLPLRLHFIGSRSFRTSRI